MHVHSLLNVYEAGRSFISVIGLDALGWSAPPLYDVVLVQLLEAHIFPKRPTSRIAVVTKLLVDQLLFAPVSTVLLFAALEAMKGTPELIPAVITVRHRFCACMGGLATTSQHAGGLQELGWSGS